MLLIIVLAHEHPRMAVIISCALSLAYSPIVFARYGYFISHRQLNEKRFG